MDRVFLDIYIAAHKQPPMKICLDVDATAVLRMAIGRDGSFTAITATTSTFMRAVAVMRRIWIRRR